jgi:hypothetical protein
VAAAAALLLLLLLLLHRNRHENLILSRAGLALEGH